MPKHQHTGIPKTADNCFSSGSCSDTIHHVYLDKEDSSFSGGDSNGNTICHHIIPPFAEYFYRIILLLIRYD
jgi:hypothetical protein